MVQGRNFLITINLLLAMACAFLVTLSGCSSSKTRATCFECLEKQQTWSQFSWQALQGTWKGSLETVSNVESAAQKERSDHAVELSFLTGENFFKAKGVESCGNFPNNAVVMMGQLWSESGNPNLFSAKADNENTIFEVFGAPEGSDQVTYGRVRLSRVNGRAICSYSVISHKVFQNRLALPYTSFTQRKSPDGRVLASGTTPETELSMEFLDFRPQARAQKFSGSSARKPAAADVQDKPQLFLRVFKLDRNVRDPFARGEWTATKEYLFRLWKI